MGISREQFSNLVKGMKAVYAQETFIPDKYAFEVWYSMLNDLTNEQLTMSIKRYMQTQKFPPTIADLRENASELEKDDVSQITELNAWGMVYKAICNSNYNAESEFEKLPEVVQDAVGNPARLREWASLPIDEVQTVVMSQFARSFRSKKELAHKEQRIQSSARLETLQNMALGVNNDNKRIAEIN